MLSEFDLIKQYFQRGRPGRAVLGIGDDCALMAPPAGMQLAIVDSYSKVNHTTQNPLFNIRCFPQFKGALYVRKFLL